MGIEIVAYDRGDKGYVAGREIKRQMTDKGLAIYLEDAARIPREKMLKGSKNLPTLLYIEYVSSHHEDMHFLASELANPEPIKFEIDSGE